MKIVNKNNKLMTLCYNKPTNLFLLTVSIQVKALSRRKQMDRQSAERITTEYISAIYGFTIKRCKNLQDAEDLSQDIAIKVFTAL